MAMRVSPCRACLAGASSLAVTSWPNGAPASREDFASACSAMFPGPSFGLLLILAPCRESDLAPITSANLVTPGRLSDSAGIDAAFGFRPQLDDCFVGRCYIGELPVHVEKADRV